MTKGRKTTYEERVEIVTYCIEHEMDYAQAAEKYQVSYQQVYQWIRKYQSDGAPGLVDKGEKEKQRMKCLNWKSCVRKTSFFKQKSEKRNWRLHS